MTRPRHLLLAAALAAATALLSGCAGQVDVKPVDPSASASDWSGMSLRELEAIEPMELVDTLEAVPTDERPTDLRVSVRPDSLIITAVDGEVSRDLPDGVFYLSVAPYVSGTHDCYFHSLTTCHGELGGEDITITVTSSTGDVLVDETRTAADNGFVGMWLPRDISGTVTVVYDGKTASTPFATGSEDPTCITTLALT